MTKFFSTIQKKRMIAWILATMDGQSLGTLVGDLLPSLPWLFKDVPAIQFLESDSGILLALAVNGLILGTLQWLVLRHRMSGTAWWILATVVGKLGLRFIPSEWFDQIWLYWGTVGLILGLSQWFVLYKVSSIKPIWIASSVIGWIMAGLVGQGLLNWFNRDSFLHAFGPFIIVIIAAVWLIGACLLGLCTGILIFREKKAQIALIQQIRCIPACLTLCSPQNGRDGAERSSIV